MSERGPGSNQYGDKPPSKEQLLAKAAEARRIEALRDMPAPRPLSEPDLSMESAQEILAVLDERAVAYVVVGGFAVRLHAPEEFATKDIDVQARRSRENLEALAEALNDLKATYRVIGDDRPGAEVPFVRWSADRLEPFTGERGNVALRTAHGPLDVGFGVHGFLGGYDELIGGSSLRPLGSLEVPTASLSDIIDSKSAAAREKDVEAIPHIIALATRLRKKKRG